jgi:lipopolysaccharide transport system permease protein
LKKLKNTNKEIIISAKKSLLNFHFKEVWQYRDLLRMFVRRDIVSLYKQTLLGPFWFFLQPLLTSATQTAVFGYVAQLPTDGNPRFLFYLAGNAFWNYFSTCITSTSNVFTGNKEIFGKVYFPRLTVPFSLAISNLVKFSLHLVMFFIFWGWYFYAGLVHPNAVALWLPLMVLAMACMGIGIGMIVSALTVRYRDFGFLVGFAVQMWMYLTPIIYPLSMAKGLFRKALLLNPMTGIIESIKYGFLGTGTYSLSMLLYSFGCTAVIFIISLLIFNATERRFIDTV